MKKDLYKVLGVSKQANKAEITKSWKKLSMEWHPDKSPKTDGDQSFANKKMQQINDAYKILSDELNRRKYDFKCSNEAEEERKSDEAHRQK